MHRWRLLLIALCLLLFAAPALATENEEEFESPTRNPHAPEYSTDTPEELDPDQIVARSFFLMERKTGNILMARNEDMMLFPASTTKVMTALIALQATEDLSEIVTISDNAMDQPDDASMVPFKAGEEVTMKDALYGLLLRSGNEAAVAIAEHVAGDVTSFVENMNQTALMLGCVNTHFVNPSGLHDELHQTTARDLATILNAAMENETFREIISTASYDLAGTNRNPPRNIENSNLHIQPGNNYEYRPSIGGKTGFTSRAGYVLVEAAAQDGVELIAVAMYSGKYSRWPDTSRLFAYGFTQYSSVTPEEIYAANPVTIQINGFSTNDPDIGELELDIRAVDPSRDVRFTNLKSVVDDIMDNFSDYTNIRWDVEHRAPIQQGQVMGVISFYLDQEEPVEFELLAARSIAARVNAPPTLEEIEQRVAEDPWPFPPFSWDWVLPPLIGAGAAGYAIYRVIRMLHRRRKRKVHLPRPKKRTYT